MRYSSINQRMLARMVRLVFSWVLVLVVGIPSTTAMARSRHQNPTNFYRPVGDPNAVFVGGTYAGSDPDPNIRGALIREFGRRPP
jgi:hypothetical protein